MYDLKSEIKLLQSKIKGLGKNLCKFLIILVNKNNSLCRSSLIASKGEESLLNNLKINKNNDNVLASSRKVELKNSTSNSRLSHSRSCTNNLVQSKDKMTKKTGKKIDSTLSKSRGSMDIPEYKTYCYREAITVWKEKYYKLMKDDQMVHKALEEERRKNEELSKYQETLDTKWNTYDKVNHKFNKLIDEYEKLLIRYEESEMIRKEQSKLIKTLKKELELLGKWTNPDSLNEEDLVIA